MFTMQIHSAVKLNFTHPSVCLSNTLSKWHPMLSCNVTFIDVISALYLITPNQNQNLVFIWSFDFCFIFIKQINIIFMWPLYEAILFLSLHYKYRKVPKYSDTQNICCNHSKIWTMWLYHRVLSPKDADRMANSADPDQTAPAPLGAVWSGSALFAQACLSENLGSLR